MTIMKAIISTIFTLLLGVASVSGNQYSSSNLYASSSQNSANYGNYDANYYGRSGAYGTNLFADSSSNEYDGYQQAWRYLGWYVKCGYPSDRYDDNGSGDHHSGSHDNQRWEGNNYCQRYLIWAAYVDENYQGGGIGEYQYFNPYSQSWDTSACSAHGNGRCAPMDCHENNSTTWTLMGVFKEASYFGNDAFFEQLFKHEGVCLWNDDDTYEFMSEAREDRWTQGCVSTGIKGDSYYFDSSSGNSYIYLDLKPTWNGNMTYGLYVDSTCKKEYEGLDIDVNYVSASMGLLYSSSLQQWNDALEVYKVCQPCRAYNLNNAYSSSSGGDDDDGGDDDPNEGYFQCDDDAGYTNVNQCMKFRSHAELEVATWEDLVTATNQGGILEVNVGGTIFGSARMSAQQYRYMTQTRREEIAESARMYAMEAQKVNAMEPEAVYWQNTGKVCVGLGSVLFLIMLMRWCRSRCCSREEPEDISAPLLHTPPPEYIRQALIQQEQERLSRSRV